MVIFVCQKSRKLSIVQAGNFSRNHLGPLISWLYRFSVRWCSLLWSQKFTMILRQLLLFNLSHRDLWGKNGEEGAIYISMNSWRKARILYKFNTFQSKKLAHLHSWGVRYFAICPKSNGKGYYPRVMQIRYFNFKSIGFLSSLALFQFSDTRKTFSVYRGTFAFTSIIKKCNFIWSISYTVIHKY